MALSNWDSIAWGNDGTCQVAACDFGNDMTAELYKNWVYLHLPGRKYPIHIQKGFLKGGFALAVERGPGESVFVLLKHGDRQLFGGVADYGYSDPVPKMLDHFGVKLTDGQEASYSSGRDEDGEYRCLTIYEFSEMHVLDRFYVRENLEAFEPEFVGVTQERINAFFEWASSFEYKLYFPDLDEWLERCQASDPLRYNQGDAYFAGHLDQDIPSSAPGEAQPTVLSNVVDAWAEKNDQEEN